jgi:hypothetical protein
VSALGLGELLYIAVAVLALRPVTGHFAWLFAERKWEHDRAHYPSITAKHLLPPSGEQWFAGALTAAAAVALWPLALAWAAMGRSWAIGAERRGQLAQSRARVEQLERELNLR